MKFNDMTIEDINKAIDADKKDYDLGLRISFIGDAVCQYSGESGWTICKLDDLTNMIKSLENVRTMIEKVTGLKV